MVAGHLQEKKGLFYIVLSYTDVENRRRIKWIPTNLPIKGNKKRAEQMLWEARDKFKPPVEKGALSSDMLFADYLEEWVKMAKSTIRIATYSSYSSLLRSVILPYFRATGVTLGDLKAIHIQKFYAQQLERVSANTVIHYHAVIHRALKYAVKIELLNANVADRVERPKKEKFIPEYYDGERISQLFTLVEGTEFELPVKLAAFYGLRRSEIIGLRWSAIDFQGNTITINHTVTKVEVDGKHFEVASDTTKTKSSLRTLPLVPQFKELLLRKKKEQEEYRRVCGKSYSKKYLDYICVNPLGDRMRCDFLTESFPKLLKRHGMPQIRFHDLRHSCASLLLANGVSMKQIQEWLGHSDFSTTANIYAHLDYHSKISSAEAILSGLSMKQVAENPGTERVSSDSEFSPEFFPKTEKIPKSPQ